MRPLRNHWVHLTYLLSALERCVDSCARMDHYRWENRGTPYEDAKHRLSLYRRMDYLRTRIEKEVSRATVERLQADLARRIAAQTKKEQERDALGVRRARLLSVAR